MPDIKWEGDFVSLSFEDLPEELSNLRYQAITKETVTKLCKGLELLGNNYCYTLFTIVGNSIFVFKEQT